MLGFAEKFKNKRAKATGPIVDLDAITSESQWVRFQGETHEIVPVTVSEFFHLANGFAHIESMRKLEKLSVNDIVDGYFGIINPVIPSITKEMIRMASAAQISALVQFVSDHINGRVDTEKKKTLTMIPRR